MMVVDCANGAAYKVAPTVLRELGAKVEVIGNKPDGMNINAGCGAVHPELLQKAVREQGAHLGVALDGDADRAIFVCEQGRVVDGDHIMAMLALDLHRQGQLAKADGGGDRHEQLRIGACHDESGYRPRADCRR